MANLFIQLHAILFKDSVIVTWPMGHVELLEERLSTPCASLHNRDSPSFVPSSSTSCAVSECTGQFYFMSFCLFVAPQDVCWNKNVSILSKSERDFQVCLLVLLPTCN